MSGTIHSNAKWFKFLKGNGKEMKNVLKASWYQSATVGVLLVIAGKLEEF